MASARQHWDYGPSSSGGIQTEAALKQFGLLEVSGRGNQRRLKLSELAVRLVGDGGLDVSERRVLTARNCSVQAADRFPAFCHKPPLPRESVPRRVVAAPATKPTSGPLWGPVAPDLTNQSAVSRQVGH